MKNLEIFEVKNINVVLDDIASDKSISHRAAIFSLLSNKTSTIRNYLQAEDTLNTLKIIEALGAKIQKSSLEIKITPPEKINEPDLILDCGNSGTAIRILIGFLSSCEGFFVLHGDKYLASRPMKRVTHPLKKLGAIIDGRKNCQFSPICIRGEKIQAFDYEIPISSAQVKTALILAGLRSNAECSIKETFLSRDHTEKMLIGMGANLEIKNLKICFSPLEKPLKPLNITIPSDPSAGFFFAVAAAIIPGSKIVLKNMLLNKTRIEAYKILQKMGAKIEFIEKNNDYDIIGDIIVEHNTLNGVLVEENIPWLIDELPALSIAFACANGKSIVRNAQELRVKESDRITSVVENLKKCKIEINEFKDGYEVIGGRIQGTKVKSFGDHRIAMSFATAGLVSSMKVEDTDCINTSFPEFTKILKKIGVRINEY